MESSEAALGFSALAQDSRLDLIRRLARQGPDGMAAGELAVALAMPPSTLSFHLNALAKAGLVDASRRGRQVNYSVRFSGLRALFGYLTETCCGGRPDLCADLARLLPNDVQQEPKTMTPAFNVLFLCTHNAGRSQMALGFFRAMAQDRAIAWSGGSEPGSEVNPVAVQAMAEMGIDISGEFPKPWTDEVVRAADVVVTMGCGDTCPYVPGKRYVDWPLDDPKGQSLEVVRRIRDDIRGRVEALVAELAG